MCGFCNGLVDLGARPWLAPLTARKDAPELAITYIISSSQRSQQHALDLLFFLPFLVFFSGAEAEALAGRADMAEEPVTTKLSRALSVMEW